MIRFLDLGMPRRNRHRTWFHVQPSHHDNVEANEALAGKKGTRPANHLDLRVENHGIEATMEPSLIDRNISAYNGVHRALNQMTYKCRCMGTFKGQREAQRWNPPRRAECDAWRSVQMDLTRLNYWLFWYSRMFFSPVISRNDHGMSCGHNLQTSYPSLVGASSSKNLFPHLARNGATTSEALAGKIMTNLKIESTSSYGKFENHFMCSAWDVGIYSAKLQGHQTEWDQRWLLVLRPVVLVFTFLWSFITVTVAVTWWSSDPLGVLFFCQ